MNVFSFDEINIHVPNNREEIYSTFVEIFDGSEKNMISFINPEIVIEAEKNIELKKYLQRTKYNFVDGIGLLETFNFYFQQHNFTTCDRYPGTDFFDYLPKNRKMRVFFLGAHEQNCRKAKTRIMDQYKNIDIVGFIDGYTHVEEDFVVETINHANADIVIVCLGCPRQELWIENHIDKINTKLIFGNGGAIDFWSGSKKRAPSFFINNKIEWMYRLSQDFSLKRIRRQLRLIPFAIKTFLKKHKISIYVDE